MGRTLACAAQLGLMASELSGYWLAGAAGVHLISGTAGAPCRAQGATSLQTGGDVPLLLPLPPFCSGDPVGWRPEERPTWCVSAVAASIWRLFWVASPMPMGTARFLRLPSSRAGRQDRQTSTTPRPNANKAKRLPRQPSNHSVRADAANNNKNHNGGRRPTESSRTGAGAGAHQKMTAPNCLIRALFLLQC
jgi:hypothetical protein